MSEQYDVKDAIVIAALFHDIGKFAQRASKGMKDLPEAIKNMKNIICRKQEKGYYSHLHSLWTLDFLEKYEKLFPLPVTGVSFSNEPTDTIANMAASHHADNLTPLQEIIKQADWLSAGMDRIKNYDIEDEKDQKVNFRKQNLRSIFSQIDLSGIEKQKKYCYKLNKLSVSDECFPELKEEYKDLTQKYEQLWNEFIGHFEKIPKDHFIDRTLSLLEMYTWAIPSTTIDDPDISLYDHSRTTAAIAAALYDYHNYHDSLNLQSVKDWQEHKFLLLGGDLSGIQNFIFRLNLQNVRGVNKILRARSFYLQMVTNVVVHHILSTLKLPSISKVIDAGGRFILLLPNTDQTIKTLTRIENHLESWFFNRFSGELSLNLNWQTSISGNDLKQENFNEILSTLSNHTEIKKKKKYFAYFTDESWNKDQFVLVENFKGFKQYDKCQSCGIFPGIESDELFGEKRQICPFCSQETKIGKWLLNTDMIGIAKKHDLPYRNIQVLDNLYSVYFLSNIDHFTAKDFDSVFLTSGLEKEQILPRKLIANYVPYFQEDESELYKVVREEDEEENLDLKNLPMKTFHHLAKLGTIDRYKLEEIGGRAMLGVLKADVDFLGQIFYKGLGNRVSISRYANLSRLLNHFFVGYLMHVLKNTKNKEEDFSDIYTVFAGGDDLLFIGEWKTIIQFSIHLNHSFKKYTCDNPDIHLSAGIANIPPRFPINQGIKQADELLENAKNEGRNRIGIFQTILTWNEFEQAMKYARFFDEQIQSQSKNAKINNSFLYRLLRYHKQFINFHDNNIVNDLIYISHLKYDIARNIVEFDKDTGKVKPEFKYTYDMLQPLVTSKGDSLTIMKNLKVPIFYAMYKNRGRKIIKQEGNNG